MSSLPGSVLEGTTDVEHTSLVKVQVKLSLCSIFQHVTEVCRGVEVYLHALVTSAPAKSASGFSRFIPGKYSCTQLPGGLMVQRAS